MTRGRPELPPAVSHPAWRTSGQCRWTNRWLVSQLPLAYRGNVATTRRSSMWSIALTAFAGAWLGHFVEYVRVAGWQAGVGEMTSSVHSYFLPAGAVLMALAVGAAILAKRAWRSLGQRLRSAQIGLWRRPLTLPPGPADRTDRHARPVGPFEQWVALTLLQTGTWIIQENLESIAAGHPAPLLGVLSGVHWLAPLIQAEVALILAAAYWLTQSTFARRRSRLLVIERLVAQRWSARYGLLPVPGRATSVPSSPLDRWGAQRWQRPPPVALLPL